MVKKDRIEYIDIAKGIGIILVIIGHSHCPAEVKNFIYFFHMPFFFFISGVLLSQRYGFSEFISDRVRYLLVPYFIIAFVSIIFSFFISRHYGNYLDVKNAFMNVFEMGFGIKADLERIYNGPLWFLPCLFYVQILGYMVTSIKTNDLVRMLCVIIISISGFLLPGESPIGFRGPLIALAFWFAGYMFNKKDFLQKFHSNRMLFKIIATLFLLIIVGFMKRIGGNISMTNVTLNNFVLFLIGGTAGSVAILTSAMAIDKSHGIEFAGKNAIIFFGFHSLAQKAIDIPRILMDINLYSLLGGNIYLFIILWNVIFCSIISLSINKTMFLKLFFLRRYN
jgi:acyltransferase